MCTFQKIYFWVIILGYKESGYKLLPNSLGCPRVPEWQLLDFLFRDYKQTIYPKKSLAHFNQGSRSIPLDYECEKINQLAISL